MKHNATGRDNYIKMDVSAKIYSLRKFVNIGIQSRKLIRKYRRCGQVAIKNADKRSGHKIWRLCEAGFEEV